MEKKLVRFDLKDLTIDNVERFIEINSRATIELEEISLTDIVTFKSLDSDNIFIEYMKNTPLDYKMKKTQFIKLMNEGRFKFGFRIYW